MKHKRTIRREAAPARFEPLESRQMMAAGALDLSFSQDGLASVDFGPGITVNARDVAVQSDGKTVVVGRSSSGDIAMARFNLDGTLDQTFGPNGNGTVLQHVGFAGQTCWAEAVAITPTGSIIVAGRGQFETPPKPNQSLNHSMILVRFAPNGKLAQYNAIEATRLGGTHAEATDIVIQSDGKIVVAGTVLQGNSNDMFVARFEQNFEMDSSFGSAGRRIIDFWGTDDFARAVAIDYSGTPATNWRYGSIVVAGTRDNPGRDQIIVARVMPDGSMYGRFQTLLPGGSTDAGGVLIQPDGKIVVAGTATFTSPLLDNKIALMRLKADGTMDSTFGTAGTGWVTTDLFGDDRAFDITRSFDGKLIVGGSSNAKSALVQYTPNGLVDRSFGTNGFNVTQSPLHSEILGLASGPGRRFVAAGGLNFGTARYLDAHANLVTVGTFNPNASEQGPKSASFIVARTERLPYATRVYFSIGGTAKAPGFRVTNPDYTLSGMNLVTFLGSAPFVEIPANQTYTLVTLTPVDDTLVEGPETATFTILPNSAYDLGTPSSTTITIADNDRFGGAFGGVGGRMLRSSSAPAQPSSPSLPGNRFADLFSDDQIKALR